MRTENRQEIPEVSLEVKEVFKTENDSREEDS